MIPAIANAQSSETARLDFPEPLSLEHQLIIEFLTERYTGDTPFMTFSRNGTTTLIVPKIVRGKIPQLGAKPNANSFTVEAPPVLRLSDRAGASNG